jgi:hypothetical protein
MLRMQDTDENGTTVPALTPAILFQLVYPRAIFLEVLWLMCGFPESTQYVFKNRATKLLSFKDLDVALRNSIKI